jgi:hypothetical protein
LATFKVTDHPDEDPWDKDLRPRLRLDEDLVFAADGSFPGHRAISSLAGLEIYRDVINKFGWKEVGPRMKRSKTVNDDIYHGDEHESDFVCEMDAWFKDAMGGGVSFTGNEGNGETTEYSCYVLTVCSSYREESTRDDDTTTRVGRGARSLGDSGKDDQDKDGGEGSEDEEEK